MTTLHNVPPSTTTTRRTRALLGAEWTKLTSVRSTWLTLVVSALLAVVVGFVGGGRAAAHWHELDPAGQAAFDPVRESSAGLLLAQLAIGVLGVLAITGEHGTGMIRTTLTATPQRRSVLLAKTIVLGGIALICGELISLVSFLAGQSALGDHGVGLDHPGALRAVLAGGYVLLTTALIGLGLGTVIRRSAGAIAALLTLLLVIDGILHKALWNTWIDRYMLGEATQRITSLHAGVNQSQISVLAGFVTVAAYATIPLITGTILISRRDV